MSPPSGSGPPPYASSPGPVSALSSSTSGLHSNATTPTQRKTVRFQNDNSEEAPVRRSSKSGGASTGAAPAIASHRDRDHRVHAVASPALGGSASGSNISPVVTPLLRTNPFPNIPYFPFYGTGFNNGSSGMPSAQLPSYDGSSSSSSHINNTTVVGNNGGSTTTTTNHNGTSSGSGSSGSGNSKEDDGKIVRPSLLQPRVAVVLGLPRIWHLPLFLSRLLSVCPAIWWSLGIFIRLITQLHALAVTRDEAKEADAAGLAIHDRGTGLSLESRLKLTETALAMIWCGASAYLSFFFTDCLMSRWLLNYTPQATIVRLLAINALNGYLTSWVIYLMGSGGDSRLLLPAWVAIAAILTTLYHVTQHKINIRKETSISISVFSFASFISMAALLAQLYWDRPEYVDVPVVALTRHVCTEAARMAGNLFDIGNITMDL
ncbi:hypothetical protein F503_03576 [Ophiostoma piceae UAMH 11346]|uniref:N-glycosylation protein EOS1 n=1 Tax=Ophiostoma piceae (strain UAMH 11346) TaxID=1262450 RepID=S3BTB5_OPHP1|nr:hypothetical protein F503_03576 [Ophiostoma piceae UAMH 11346]